MSNFLKATAVRDTTLRALARMLTLAPTVWRNPAGSFKGVLGDTVTLRVPAYTVANSRNLRATPISRTRAGLFEAAVPITLAKELYRDVPLTHEVQSLDVIDFSRQVLSPMLQAIARGIEDEVAGAIEGATYEYNVDFDSDNPYGSVIDARKHLNDARVPMTGRTLAVGSSLEAALLQSAQFARADQSGSTQTLRQGVIGNIAGFTVVTSPSLEPDEGYAYHNTAYGLSLSAPLVPDGAPSGFTASEDGFAIRVVQVLDSDTIENIISASVYVGATEVIDHGTVDEDTGVFTPAEEPDNDSGTDEVFVRGVKLAIAASSSS